MYLKEPQGDKITYSKKYKNKVSKSAIKNHFFYMNKLKIIKM